MTETDEVLSVPRAAALLGMHPGAVHKAIVAGRLQATRNATNTAWQVTRADIAAYQATPRQPGGRPRAAAPPAQPWRLTVTDPAGQPVASERFRAVGAALRSIHRRVWSSRDATGEPEAVVYTLVHEARDDD